MSITLILHIADIHVIKAELFCETPEKQRGQIILTNEH